MMEFLDQYKKMKEMINDLKNIHGCIGIKMSTEDQGNSITFIDFIKNRFLKESLPLNVKIGGPDARNDIMECLKISVSGIIAPMVESPFGVYKFITALQTLAGEDSIRRLMVSVNLESLNAYQNIDEILGSPEIEHVDQIVIGTSDLARSVLKPVDDPMVIDMVREMALKSKRAGKIVRVGGIMSLAQKNAVILERILDETDTDRVNTSNVCFSVDRIPELRLAYIQALRFEMGLNSMWISLHDKNIAPIQQRLLSLREKIV